MSLVKDSSVDKDIFHILYENLDTRLSVGLFVCPVFVTLTVPQDSKTGWNGDCWARSMFLKRTNWRAFLQTFFIIKKNLNFVQQTIYVLKMLYRFFFRFWNFVCVLIDCLIYSNSKTRTKHRVITEYKIIPKIAQKMDKLPDV